MSPGNNCAHQTARPPLPAGLQCPEWHRESYRDFFFSYLMYNCNLLYLSQYSSWCVLQQICSLMRGGIAERGGVRVGHRIIEINTQSVVATPHEKIVHILSNAVGEVRFHKKYTNVIWIWSYCMQITFFLQLLERLEWKHSKKRSA